MSHDRFKATPRAPETSLKTAPGVAPEGRAQSYAQLALIDQTAPRKALHVPSEAKRSRHNMAQHAGGRH
eukprot:9495322-Pyramimonas_sp.AAC.1